MITVSLAMAACPGSSQEIASNEPTHGVARTENSLAAVADAMARHYIEQHNRVLAEGRFWSHAIGRSNCKTIVGSANPDTLRYFGIF